MKTRKLTLEILEDRCLPSGTATPSVTLWADSTGIADQTADADGIAGQTADADKITNTTVVGYTPAQIRHAYGFDQTPSLQTNGYNTAGQGQIIAIVDAYDDPNIASDLHVFDQQFGIPDTTLIKVNQNGSTTGPWPKVNSGWAGEISLDVEWAHAIAPAATILLVEARSNSLSDLLAAVDTARNWAGVSVVSMSWGGNEWSGETSYDSHLTTPAGHTPITFSASAGDTGSSWGLYWPAASPNVLAVGGSSLTINADNSYGGETGWSGGTGGVSAYESQPSWQSLFVTNSQRTDPDVSYHADNSTKGFAVYDTVRYYGQTGWFNAGGDSAGAPQWAALVAIADQVRGSALDGPTQTLPALYQLAQQNYGQYFHDITSGSNGGYTAAAGYDEVTGIGSPKADQLIQALAAWTGSAGSSTSSGGTGAFGGSAGGLIDLGAHGTQDGALNGDGASRQFRGSDVAQDFGTLGVIIVVVPSVATGTSDLTSTAASPNANASNGAETAEDRGSHEAVVVRFGPTEQSGPSVIVAGSESDTPDGSNPDEEELEALLEAIFISL